jgi:hypothetical protein
MVTAQGYPDRVKGAFHLSDLAVFNTLRIPT